MTSESQYVAIMAYVLLATSDEGCIKASSGYIAMPDSSQRSTDSDCCHW